MGNKFLWIECSLCVKNDSIAPGERQYILSTASGCSQYIGNMYPKSDYWFGIEEVLPVNAAEICAGDGAHLIYVETYEELEALNQFAQEGVYWEPYDDYWTGAFWDEASTGYYWTDGNEIDNATALWTPGEPSMGPKEACVRLKRKNVNGKPTYKLSDEVCNRNNGIICEMDL